MTVWQHIYTHLKNAGFDVYSPGQHQGECVAPYIVVRDAGIYGVNGISSEQALYEILCYVPKDRFSTLEPYVEDAKAAMKELYPMLIPTHYQTDSYLDDSVKGHMVSVQYKNNRKYQGR